MSQNSVPPPASGGQPWTFLLLFVMAGFAVFGKTTIGWPVSGENVLAFILLLGAVALMCMAVFLRQVPPLLLPVSMIVVALVMLQLLPEAGTGLQVVPNLPWSYSGWMPVMLSVAAWLFLLLAILVSADAYDAAVVTPMFLLWAMAFTLPLSFWGGEPTVVIPSPWQQVAEWRMKKVQGERVLSNLQRDRDRLVEHLHRLGMQSSADLKKVPAARPVAKELADVVGQIEVVEERNQRFGSAIADIESKLRRVGRREVIGEVGLTAEEEKDLTRRGLELEAELGELTLPEVDEIVDEVLSE